MSAAMSALAPAWEALEEGMHKAPQGGAFPPSSPGSRTGKVLLHAGGPSWVLWSLYALLLLSCAKEKQSNPCMAHIVMCACAINARMREGSPDAFLDCTDLTLLTTF